MSNKKPRAFNLVYGGFRLPPSFILNTNLMKYAKLESILSKWVKDYNTYHKVTAAVNSFKTKK